MDNSFAKMVLCVAFGAMLFTFHFSLAALCILGFIAESVLGHQSNPQEDDSAI